MAGGMDWFRWHHGTVTDQKFPLIAKRAGASVAEVIAVWACLLEAASMSEERGLLSSEPDFEAMECALGLEDRKARRIFAAMQARDLIDEHLQVVQWDKRQPKREDDTAAERKRRQREREHELAVAPVTDGVSRNVTQSHADVTHGHDRREESREEERNTPLPPKGGDARFADFWTAWPSSVRKQDRKKCLDKWKRNRWDGEADAIVAHVVLMAQSKQWREGFEPAPLTYLNGERWRDGTEAAGRPVALFAGGI